MKLHRRALAALLGATALIPGVAAAAPTTVPPAAPRPGAVPVQTEWWVSAWDYLSGDALIIGKQVGLSLLLFLAGWLVAKFVAWLVFRGLCKTQFDNKLAEKLRLGILLEPDAAGTAPKAPPPNALERFIANIVYYMLMLLVLVGVLQFAGLTQAAGPIQGLVDTVVQALPLIGKAIVILLVAYFGGTLLAKLITRGLSVGFLSVDRRMAELQTEDPVAAGAAGAAAATQKPFSRTAGDVVFWIVMAAGLAGAFDALRITPIAEPLNNALDRVIGIIPSLGVAALLVLAGYILGRIVRVVIHNLLDSLGFNRLADRIGIGKLFGTSKPSAVLGTIVMAFIMFQASIAALNQLGLVTLSGPLTDMMARFWLVLPNLAVSVLVIAAGVVIGRMIRGVVAATLRNLGFDRMVARLGISTISARPDRLGEPSELVGFLIHVAIVILATAQACENLQLHTWAVYLNQFLGYAIKNVLVALVVVAVGVAIGNYVRDVILARGADPLDNRNRWLAEFARYTILVFAVTMAIQQLQVAENFVLLAFGLLFGSLCLAFALAFGLGSKDVAGEIVRKSVKQVQDDKPPTATVPARTPTSPGSLFTPGGGL